MAEARRIRERNYQVKRVQYVLEEEEAKEGAVDTSFLCSFFARNLTTHNLIGCTVILPTLGREINMSQDMVMRGTLIAVHTILKQPDHPFHSGVDGKLDYRLKNLLYLFFRSFCLKTEVLLELMNLLMEHGFYKDVSEDFPIRASSYIDRGLNDESFIIIESLVSASFALLDYMAWLENLQTDTETTAVEHEMVTDAVCGKMEAIITSRPGPFDHIIPRFLDLKLYQGDIENAIETLMSYKNRNPNNTNAYIYLLKFIVRYGKDYEDSKLVARECFSKIFSRSPSASIILEMLDYDLFGPSKSAIVLMEFIDYTENKDNHIAWKKLFTFLIKCQVSIKHVNAAKSRYVKRHRSYWPIYHWDPEQLNSCDHENYDLIIYKHHVAKLLQPDSSFIRKAELWLEKLGIFISELLPS